MLKFSEEIKGHDLIQHQICRALERNRLPHALLFSGPSGIGKRKSAWALAKSLLCESSFSLSSNNRESLSLLLDISSHQDKKEEKSYKACGLCLFCRNIEKQESEHVLEIKHETLQIRLRDLQPILSFLSLESFAKAKIVLIDSAEKLNSQASNFLLKTIEEPPPHSFFFLISSQPSQILSTIRSRVQNILFNPLSDHLLAELSSPDTQQWMIKSARGQMNLLMEFKEKQELRQSAFNLFLDCFKKDPLEIDFSQILRNRQTALDVLRFWRLFLRDLRLLSLSMEEELTHRDQAEKMRGLPSFSKQNLDFWIKHTIDMEYELKSNFDINLCFENFAVNLKKSLKSSFIRTG